MIQKHSHKFWRLWASFQIKKSDLFDMLAFQGQYFFVVWDQILAKYPIQKNADLAIFLQQKKVSRDAFEIFLFDEIILIIEWDEIGTHWNTNKLGALISFFSNEKSFNVKCG